MAGKPRYVESVPRPHIDCCFVGCANSANVRLWTKTGWANVCARVNALEIGPFHYEAIEQVPRVTNNYLLDEIRAARRNTEPALGIPTDALERELAERMNP